jgi:hypothetical protein
MLAGATIAAQAQSADDRPTHWKAGIQVGTVHDNGKGEPSAQISFGYEIDRTWSVEALLNTNLLFVRDGTDPTQPYEFDSAYGARVLAALPVSGNWSLVGGLGVTRIHEERGLTIHGYGRDRVGAMVSAAAMYRIDRRWSVGLELSSFTQSHTFNAGLRGEIHF